ncbi:DUF6114 domain-containing protein [Streptomyces sp. NPDC054863]
MLLNGLAGRAGRAVRGIRTGLDIRPRRDARPGQDIRPGRDVQPGQDVRPRRGPRSGLGGSRRRLLKEGRLDERLPWPERRRRFRSWRRRRPFWAGLLLALAGAELLLVPLSPLPIMVSLGLGGLAALGIGLALIAAALFLWFLPHTRHYVSVNALILSVLSFAATNLGGFLVGTLLGIAGSAMGFGWTPVTGPGTPAADPADGERRAPTVREHRGPRTLAVALPVVLLVAIGAPAQRAAAAAAEPQAPRTPPTVTTTRFAPDGFLIAGVKEVRTVDGPLKVMVLKMRAASLTDYELRTHDGRDELSLGADSLDLSGDVTLYLTKFSGCLQGMLCLTFTPDGLPVPPVVPPFVYMTDVSAEQAMVTSDSIDAFGLRLGAS